MHTCIKTKRVNTFKKKKVNWIIKQKLRLYSIWFERNCYCVTKRWLHLPCKIPWNLLILIRCTKCTFWCFNIMQFLVKWNFGLYKYKCAPATENLLWNFERIEWRTLIPYIMKLCAMRDSSWHARISFFSFQVIHRYSLNNLSRFQLAPLIISVHAYICSKLVCTCLTWPNKST